MAKRPEHRILGYTRFLKETRGLAFDPATYDGYDALWRWSCTDLEAFWQSIWDHAGLHSPTPHARVLAEVTMPGARWFEGAQVNYAQHLFSHADAAHAAGHPAIVFRDERLMAEGRSEELSWPELRRQVGALAASLQALGVQQGDRVCAYLPNVPETVIAFLATASLGAIWSVCSPDMGPLAVLDRFRQIEPVVLIACNSYTNGGVTHDRRAVVDELVANLPSLRHVVTFGEAAASGGVARHCFHDLAANPVTLVPRWLPFDHALWIVYSSGTTGLPKPIVHGHGGVMIEALKSGLHNDVGPTAETGDRYFWHSSTGWIMWNSQVGALLGGTTVCMFDGSPSGPESALPGEARRADWSTLFRFAGATGVTHFGSGAAFYASCLKAGVEPMQAADLSAVRAVGSTGSPLSEDCYDWIWAHFPVQPKGEPVWLNPISGGTDFAGAFVAGLPTLPVTKGEMQTRCLGAAVEAWSDPDPADPAHRGHPLTDAVGELVCVKPMPSMPLYLWGDQPPGPFGQRYHDSYFEMYPGGAGQHPVWRHGDWIRITPRGGAVIYGRSDATINRHGVRMGTAELYRSVESHPEVLDSMVVDLEYLGRESWMPLFVVLRDGLVLDAGLAGRIKADIRRTLSPRHVPNDIFQVQHIPRTLSGKKMELPVKKLLMGTPAEQLFKPGAMANADAVAWFVEFARRPRPLSP